jgi:hypothetical protein
MYYELYHHGIKGQRWGIRRFQNKDGSLTARGKKRYGDDGSASKKKEDESRNKGLTDKQKKAIKIGAAVVGTALVAYGGYKLSQYYRGVGSKIDPETGFRLIDKDMSDADNLLAINPGRVRFLSKSRNMEIINGSSTNCMLCTTAYEFRKRGLDVHAGLEKTGNGYMPDDLFPKLFKDYKGTTKIYRDVLDTSTDGVLRNIEKYATDQGHGSRGNVIVWWKQGGGHSMIWENVNGKIVFKDGQTNQIYDDFGKQILKHTMVSKPVEMLRTDNLTINTETAKNFINPHTLTRTYVDHGGEIALKAANTPVGRLGLYAAGFTVLSKASTKAAVNNYKREHPNTKLTDKEIAELLTKSG